MLWNDGFVTTPQPISLAGVNTPITYDYGGSGPTEAAYLPSSNHSGTVVTSFADGSVKAISTEIEANVYARLMTSEGRKARLRGTGTPYFDNANLTSGNWQQVPISDSDIP